METVAKQSLQLCGLFEAEILVELLLRCWGHPLADDQDFRNYLLESACEVLGRSVGGETFLQELSPPDMNFVAAVWYSEWAGVSACGEGVDARQEWLEDIRRALPSCFCSPRDLLP